MATAGPTVAAGKKRDIFDLANICEDLFSRYADPNLPLPEPKARADLQQQRFEVWASYLGIFAPYDVSLDRRLEYSEEIRNLVLQLLSLMRRNLDFVLESHKEILPDSSNDDVKELDAKPTLKGSASEALDAVEATINRLNRLGSIIRRYSTSSLETRVKGFTARYGDENYTALAKLIVRFRYMTASTSLQEHLAVSMSARRQRLRYVSQHQAKLAGREQKAQMKQQDQPDVRTSLSPALVQITEERGSENSASPEPIRNRKQRAVRSSRNNSFLKMLAPSDMGSKASTFKPPPTVVAQLRRGDGASVVSSSKNSKTLMAEDLEDYPQAPRRELGKPVPSCPFCFKPLEESELKLGKWQRHVNKDLQPFVCISEKCSQPPQSFEDFDIWAKHMRDSHSSKWTQHVHKPVIWRCDLYHEEEAFAEQGSFEEHLTSKHANFSLTEREALSRSSKSTRRRRPNICPLCGYDIFLLSSTKPTFQTRNDSTSDPTNSSEADLLHKLAKHIAGHLRLLAFSSAENLDARSDDSCQGSMKTLDMKTRDGSKTHPPSGLKDLSRGDLSFIDDSNEFGPTRQSPSHVDGSKNMDPDWSTEEVASLNIAPEILCPTEGLSWTMVKEKLKKNLQPHILADLEREWQQESPDLLLQHIYERQLLKANQYQPSDTQRIDQHMFDAEDGASLRALRTTDPREDKRRIEQTKGGVLKDSYRWILENPVYQQWCKDTQRPLLWINGNPGTGKTMLICGIINELSREKDGHALLSYFFCQATDMRLNDATAVLRGLIYLLADQQPTLLHHVRKKYDASGKDTNAWTVLSEIITNVLQDPTLERTYVIIDALDECVTGLQQLLQFVNKTSLACPRVKWIISSRNWPSIEEQLHISNQTFQLRLELNQNLISAAVNRYIEYKVGELAKRKKYSIELEGLVREYLTLNADASFLWVASVLEELEMVERRNALMRVKAFPPGLFSLYERMMVQVSESNNASICKRILCIVAVVKRPITLEELVSLDDVLHKLDFPENLSEDIEDLEQMVGQCGSFLTIRDRTVYFVHQSAKEFLLQKKTSLALFPSGISEVNHAIFSRSLQVMSMVLRCDVYNLRAPGILIDQVKQPDPDPLATVRYSCLYWVDHLLDCQISKDISNDFRDSGPIHIFFRQYFLYWLEALSLFRSVSEGVVMIQKLEDLTFDSNSDLHNFIHDARRFAVSTRSIIEWAPLQAYCSALVFAPEKSIVRETFEGCIPSWIQKRPRVETHWNAMLQVLEGHIEWVTSVAFSPDGKQIVSGSDDQTIRLWDAATGALQQTLEGHIGSVTSVAFSPDSKQIVSGSWDKTVRRWDAATGQQLPVLEGYTDPVTSVAFSPDGKQIVSGSRDQTIRLWDAATGALQQTLEGYTSWVTSVAFSPDSKQIVSGSWDQTVRLWDAAIGALQQTLEGHTSSVTSVAFSPDGKQIVSGSDDQTVRLWDAATGALQQTLEGHTSLVTSVAFSPNGKQIVSGSWDKTVRRWDAAIGALQQTLEGHTSSVTSVAFSPNGKQIVSGSWDKTVRRWDAAIGALQQTLEGYTSLVTSVAFSPDGKQIVSRSGDQTVRRWDAATGQQLLPVLEGHTEWVTSMAFSPDGKQIVSGSEDQTVRRWDAATGQQLLPVLKGHTDRVTSVAFSQDGKQIVSGSRDQTVRRWDVATGQQLLPPVLEGHTDWVTSVAFSPDGKQIVSGSRDQTVRRWDAATGQQLLPPVLEGHTDWVTSVAFSPDGKQIVSGSRDKTVRRWDAATGQQLLPALEGYIGPVTSVAFSPDGKQIPTLHASEHWLVDGTANILWLPTSYRPTCEAIWGETIALGHSLRGVSVLQFQQGRKLVK